MNFDKSEKTNKNKDVKKMAVMIQEEKKEVTVMTKPNESISMIDVEKFNKDFHENTRILNSFYKLTDNWDGFYSLAPPEELIDKTRMIIEKLSIQPDIFPTPNGGIQLEYVNNNLHLNIELLSVNEMNIFETISDSEYIEMNCAIEFNMINRRVKEFYGF